LTAAQVIEQLKALAPEERAKVIDIIEETKAKEHVRYAGSGGVGLRRAR